MIRFAASFVVASFFVVACNAPLERQEWENTFVTDEEDAFLVDDDFNCIADAPWEAVENFRVMNVRGHQAEAVEVARSHRLAEYPVGTMIQLFHDEASVKRARGFAPETNDWEFFTLGVADDGATVIKARGTTEIGNVAGSCMSCHGAAIAYDLVCGTNSSCKPLPFFINTEPDAAVEDPRCGG